MAERAAGGGASVLQRALEVAFSCAVGFVLFGDYLALSLSRLWTGSPGNWILCAALIQMLALLLALALGRLRGLLLDLPALGCAMLGAVLLIHQIDRALSGARLDEYGTDKVLAFFLICAPALLLGLALGRRERLAGIRWVPLMIAPLLVMTVLALASDPRLLTIAHFTELGVFFGVLVLPAHQALAYSLAKVGLLLHALVGSSRIGPRRRALALVLIGALCGLTLLTGARGYCVALCAALALQWSFGHKRVGWTLLATVLAVLLVQGFAGELIVERFDVDQIGESNSYRERQDVWHGAYAAFLERPLFGQGPGGFAGFFHEQGRVYPHNLVLEIASELGAVGLGCLALMFAPTLARIARLWRSDRKPDEVQLFAIGFLAFALVGAMSVGDLIRNHFLFLALGLSIGALRSVAPARAPRRLAIQRAAEAAL